MEPQVVLCALMTVAARLAAALGAGWRDVARRITEWAGKIAADTDPAERAWPVLRDYPYSPPSSR